MSKVGQLIVLVMLFFSLSAQANNQATSNKAFRNFWHPTYLGERVDYCSLDGHQCGKEIADKYCHLMGYDNSSQNTIAYNIGLTNYIESRAQCKGWRCNGFVTINCATQMLHTPPQPYHYSEKRFVYPRYQEYRIDWCYKHNKQCGKKVANSFCNRIGYMKAQKFEKETLIGATKTIGSEELCFGNQCNGFKSIICSR